jgi:hypothetical protein
MKDVVTAQELIQEEGVGWVLMAHISHPKILRKLRSGGSQFKASQSKKFMRPPSQPIVGSSGTCLSF